MTDLTPSIDSEPDIIVGRDKVYARLQQHILDPSRRHAMMFTGHSGIGKTALLRYFPTVFEDDPFLSIFVSLSQDIITTPHDFLETVIDGILVELAEANFSLSRVPHLSEERSTSLHDWFNEIFLPEVFAIIRPHRRIICLVDDVQRFHEFGDETMQYWHDILTHHEQFSMAMTLHTDFEHLLPEFVPLIDPVQAERLNRLSQEDSQTLIHHYASGARDQIVMTIFKATGGHPRLLTHYGQILRGYWAEYSDTDAFERAMVDAYQVSQADFREMWEKLTRNERLVLTAIASLIYDDPLQAVTSRRIETWLVETDYLLDLVTINAALRGLDYQDIVRHKVGENIELTTALMQQWLLEQARLDDTVSEQRGQVSLRLIILAVVVIVILIALALWIPPQYIAPVDTILTATLSS
ncbi:MAG: ATP-binding protein [Chloroflexota bacterium]